MNKTILLFFLSHIFFLTGCSEKVSYKGLVLDSININYKDLNTKNQLIQNLGNPNYIDPIENKYIYFSEKIISKNFLSQKIDNRILIIFFIDDKGKITNVEEYNLDNEQDIKIVKKRTSQELIKQGLIENIFGGVGATAPTTP